MSVRAQIDLKFSGIQVGAGDLGNPTVQVFEEWAKEFENGTGSGQADLLFGDTRVLAASASENLDLAGALVDSFGATITFARIRGLLVVAPEGNTNDVVVGGAATNTWVGPFGAATHTHAVRPGGAWLAMAPGVTGWPVTAGTGDLLKVANGGAGTPVTYTVVLLGASA